MSNEPTDEDPRMPATPDAQLLKDIAAQLEFRNPSPRDIYRIIREHCAARPHDDARLAQR